MLDGVAQCRVNSWNAEFTGVLWSTFVQYEKISVHQGCQVYTGEENIWSYSMEARMGHRTWLVLHRHLLNKWVICVRSILMWVLYLNIKKKGKEREKERESVLRSAGSVHRSLQPLGLSWEPELGTPCLGSHMVGRDSATWTVTCCLSRSMLAGSWNWEPEPGSECKYSKNGLLASSWASFPLYWEPAPCLKVLS